MCLFRRRNWELCWERAILICTSMNALEKTPTDSFRSGIRPGPQTTSAPRNCWGHLRDKREVCCFLWITISAASVSKLIQLGLLPQLVIRNTHRLDIQQNRYLEEQILLTGMQRFVFNSGLYVYILFMYIHCVSQWKNLQIILRHLYSGNYYKSIVEQGTEVSKQTYSNDLHTCSSMLSFQLLMILSLKIIFLILCFHDICYKNELHW